MSKCGPDPQDGRLTWHEARFPHADFDRLNPGRKVYGWYAHPFRVPLALQGRDLVLDLGVIDDADIAYVNGQVVGKTADFSGTRSAWSSDRLYRIPAACVTRETNLLLVHVFDIWGLGGITGQPVLGACLVPKQTKWQFRALKTPALPVDDAVDEWKAVTMPDRLWDRRVTRDSAFGLYRVTFELPEDAAAALTPDGCPGPVLDLGPVFDVATVHLNGTLIGRLGEFPAEGHAAFVRTGKPLRCFLPTRLLRVDGQNRLEIIVCNTEAFGGLPGIPSLLFEPRDLAPFTWGRELSKELAETLPPAPKLARVVPGRRPAFPRLPEVRRCFAQALSAVDVYLNSGEAKSGERLLRRLERGRLVGDERAAVLSKRVYLHLFAYQVVPHQGTGPFRQSFSKPSATASPVARASATGLRTSGGPRRLSYAIPSTWGSGGVLQLPRRGAGQSPDSLPPRLVATSLARACPADAVAT